MGAKDTREVVVRAFRAVVVPVRKGKGRLSIRYEDMEQAVREAKDGGGKILFDLPGNGDPVDFNLSVMPDSLEAPREGESHPKLPNLGTLDNNGE